MYQVNCPKCDNVMVRAQATNFGAEYDYCRTCKKEWKELVESPKPKPSTISQEESQRLIEELGLDYSLDDVERLYEDFLKSRY